MCLPFLCKTEKIYNIQWGAAANRTQYMVGILKEKEKYSEKSREIGTKMTEMVKNTVAFIAILC